MKRLMLVAIFFAIAAPTFAQGPEEFVGKWKSDPGTPTMTRELTLEGKTIVMIELQPGRNGGPDLTIIRKYPTDGSEVTMDIGMWAGSKVTGKALVAVQRMAVGRAGQRRRTTARAPAVVSRTMRARAQTVIKAHRRPAAARVPTAPHRAP
jgi:hypothetical protein